MKRNSTYNNQAEPKNKIIVKIEERRTPKSANYNVDYRKNNIESNNENSKVIPISII